LILMTLAQLQQTDPERLLTAVTEDRWARAQLLAILWHLVACRRIGVDLSQPLTMRSPLWPVES
jgi:nicotinic acid mononucleotide adenylyltransferase